MLSVEKPDFYELPDGRFIGFVIGFSSAFRLERHCRAVFFHGGVVFGGLENPGRPKHPVVRRDMPDAAGIKKWK